MTNKTKDAWRKNIDWKLAGRRAFASRLRKAGLSQWHAKEAAGLLEQKTSEREAIFSYITENHCDGQMNYLGLAGSRFALERRLAKETPHEDGKSTFVSIERDAKFIKAARHVFDKSAPGGKLKDTTISGFKALRNKRTTVLNIKAGDLGKVALPDAISAVWYDGMGLLNTKDFQSFLKGLRSHIARGVGIPAVFTLQVGRDAGTFYRKVPGDVLGKRVRKLISLCRKAGLSFDLEDYWSYESDTNSVLPMMNVFGILRRVSKDPAGRARWSMCSFGQFDALRTAMSPNGMAGLLGLSAPTVKNYSPERAADIVSQVAIARILLAVG